MTLLPLTQVLFTVALASQAAPAQTGQSPGQRIIHQSWTFKEGAPESVNTLAQTADGYLWLGSPFGLYRFDGVRFETFRPRSGQLLSTNVAKLFAPRAGGLWIGYRFGGFSFLKNGALANFDLATGTVIGFAEDAKGTVWAAATSGVYRFGGSCATPSTTRAPLRSKPKSRTIRAFSA